MRSRPHSTPQLRFAHVRQRAWDGQRHRDPGPRTCPDARLCSLCHDSTDAAGLVGCKGACGSWQGIHIPGIRGLVEPVTIYCGKEGQRAQRCSKEMPGGLPRGNTEPYNFLSLIFVF